MRPQARLRLQQFLYVLVRDEIVSGRIESIFAERFSPDAMSIDFSCPHNAALAKEWVEKILGPA